MNNFGLSYNVNKVAAVEKTMGRPLSALVKELQSEDGASLSTLRALVAGGRMRYPELDMSMTMELPLAGTMIDKHGTAAISGAVGRALGDFLKELSEARDG